MRRLFLTMIFLLLSVMVAQAQQTFTDDDDVTYTVEQVMPANYPVAMAFTEDGRLFYTEKNTGNVRVIGADGVRQVEPVFNATVSVIAERGMLGIALDPNYAENGYIWVMYTAEATATDYPANKVVRFAEVDGVGSDPVEMLSVPLTDGSLIHNGGNLRFDDEGYLYVTLGDHENPANSQDLTTLKGAIHRFAVEDDALVPAPDNPFEDNSIYVYGVRNSFDFDFDDERNVIYATENGDQCDDEINLIIAGFQYGAGENYECGRYAEGIELSRYLPPLLSFTPTQAPTGIVVYDHEAVPEWQGKLFFCIWNDGYPSLRKITLDDGGGKVEIVEEMELGEGRCRIDIEIAPDGALYMTTVGADGGAIWRLIPQ